MFITLYLAGPMRGYPRFNFDTFESAYQDLKSRGYNVISPHNMDLDAGFDPDKCNPYDMPHDEELTLECIRRDVDAILLSNICAFMSGWEKSIGAQAEYAIAQWANRPCITYPDLKPLILSRHYRRAA